MDNDQRPVVVKHIFYGGANPKLEKSTPTYKLNPNLALAKETPSTTTAPSADFIYQSSHDSNWHLTDKWNKD